MNKCFKIFFFLIISLILNTEAKAYQVAVWEPLSNTSNQVLFMNSRENSFKSINKTELANINPKIFPVIIFTNYKGLDNTSIVAISNYLNKGGKIIISTPLYQSEDATFIKLAKLVGVTVNTISNISYSIDVNWVEHTVTDNKLYPNTRIAKVSLQTSTSHLAVFSDIEKHESAISLNPKGSVISWAFGKSGSKNFNDKSMNYLLQDLLQSSKVSNVANYNSSNNSSNSTYVNYSSSSSVINDEDIKKLQENRRYFELYQDNIINYAEDVSTAQENLELSKINELWALYDIKTNNSENYKKHYKLAKDYANKVVLANNDISPAENRGIWFDRGTIVSIRSKSEMGRYFDKLKKSGINTVYFETVNAGYTVYPSAVGVQNPLTKGRDPLAWAVEEAHERKMKIQAWVWVFAVGNDRHNKIINKSNDYPGPVLEKNIRWAMLGENGNLRPKNQPEFWLDPSNQEANAYLTRLITEILKNYNVDGIQLDYIRYPFQSNDNLMGLNHNSIERFTAVTGEKLLANDNQTNFLFNKWKENNINSFVKDISKTIKRNKPTAQVSAAIFSKAYSNRLTSIQQNWEYWLQNKYIDSLAPMSYSTTQEGLATNLSFLKSQAGCGLIYPGVALQHVDEVGILKQSLKISELGFPGISFFAVAQLKDDNAEFMQSGMFSQNTQDASDNAKRSAILLLENYKKMLNTISKNNYDLTMEQKSQVSSLITLTSSTLLKINSGQVKSAIESLSSINSQNDLLFKYFSSYNPVRKQLAKSYIKRAENLLKISLK